MAHSRGASGISITTVRAYDARKSRPESGTYRVLIDRLWPRGVSKASLHLDEWCKEVAPSDELRSAYHRDDLDFSHFSQKFRAELRDTEAVADLAAAIRSSGASGVELIYAAKDGEHSNAPIVQELLTKALSD